MTATPLYNLTWGDYGSTLVSAVQLLRCHGELVDVTLAAGGRTFSAHKVVLSAASPFLLEILKSTTCKHPIVMLAGVQAVDLEALLEFMYRGEVSVDQNQLPSLLQAAHCLNIQGLAPLNTEMPQEVASNNVKTVLDISKSTNMVDSHQESLRIEQEDDEIRVSSAKRKKRTKRMLKDSTSPPSKWAKVFVEIDPSDNVITPTNESYKDEEIASNWVPPSAISQTNIAPNTVEAIPLQNPIILQGLVTTSNTASTSPPKIRGASDQPGTCPLCGSMLKQARNLRRHLLTSCKYRMVGSSQSLLQESQHHHHHLHPISTVQVVQELESSGNRSTRELGGGGGKASLCSELSLPSTSNIMDLNSTNL